MSGGSPGAAGLRRLHDETGDIITSWLGQLVMIMAVLGLIAFELLSVGLTAVAVNDAAVVIARAGARVYEGPQSADVLEATIAEAAETAEVEVVGFAVEEDHVVVSVTRQAGTLWAHRIGPLADATSPTGSARADWNSR